MKHAGFKTQKKVISMFHGGIALPTYIRGPENVGQTSEPRQTPPLHSTFSYPHMHHRPSSHLPQQSASLTQRAPCRAANCFRIAGPRPRLSASAHACGCCQWLLMRKGEASLLVVLVTFLCRGWKLRPTIAPAKQIPRWGSAAPTLPTWTQV
jgi:hypothetical protein